MIKKASPGGIMLIVIFVLSTNGYGARVKDIAGISGVRDNQLIGYGLVVGLAGTGDDVKNGFTRETLTNLLSRQGLSMRDQNVKSDNTAAVVVTATLPPFAKVGSSLDVEVSSIGNAKSLFGGTLLMTPLRGADGKVYALAQGGVVLGGFTAGGTGSSNVKNHPSAGRVANGALVERELEYGLARAKNFTINLYHPDFTTSVRLAGAINRAMTNVKARELDSSSVSVELLGAQEANILEVIGRIENLEVPVDSRAVVVLNEKTGTVVMGENVRISTVAVAHGNLSIQIKEDLQVSQPLPFAPSPPRGSAPRTDEEKSVTVAPGGQTVVVTNKTTTVTEDKNQLMVIPRGVTIQDVVKALNAVGVTPRDLIAILQTIKAAGALQADLKIL